MAEHQQELVTETPQDGEKWIVPGEGPLTEEYDTPAEVDAVFRAQRRLSFRYGLLFFGGTLLIPLVLVWGGAWVNRPLWGGFTLGWLAVTVFYPVFYLSLGVAYTLQANRLEQDLLERRDRS